MTKFKFTAASLTRHFEEFGTTSKTIVWDTDVRGLGAYRANKGICTLFVQYRLANGVQRKKVLGRLHEFTVASARSMAMEYTLAGRHGRDLVGERKAVDEPGLSLSDAYMAHTTALKRRGASPNTLRLNARNWSASISRYKSRDLATISRTDVRAGHLSWDKRGPTVANQAARLLRANNKLCARQAHCSDLRKPVPGNRVL